MVKLLWKLGIIIAGLSMMFGLWLVGAIIGMLIGINVYISALLFVGLWVIFVTALVGLDDKYSLSGWGQ